MFVVSIVCCQVEVSATSWSLVQRSPTDCGVRHCVWSRNIKNEVMTRVGSQRYKKKRWTDFSNLFLEWNSTCFGQFLCPSSGVFHCTHRSGICHTGLLTACKRDQSGSWSLLQAVSSKKKLWKTVQNSWWWTEDLSETCRVSFQE